MRRADTGLDARALEPLQAHVDRECERTIDLVEVVGRAIRARGSGRLLQRAAENQRSFAMRRRRLRSRFLADAWDVISRHEGALASLAGQPGQPGRLVELTLVGDESHRGGAQPMRLRFEGGSVLLKKGSAGPSRLLDVAAQRVAPDGADLKIPRATQLDRTWAAFEWIPHRPTVATSAAADVFYRRFGVAAAVCWALGVGDRHYENVVVCDGQPVMIDLEDCLGTDVVDWDMYRTMLVPTPQARTGGVSGIVGEPRKTLGLGFEGAPGNGVVWALPANEAHHRALQPDGRPWAVSGHMASLRDGFSMAAEAISSQAVAVEADACALRSQIASRRVLRSTAVYTAFLLELMTPSILGRRQRVGRTAVRLSGLSAVGSHRRVVASELLDLWRGDIPWFTTSPQSPRVRHHGGRVVANTSRTGLEALSLRLSLLRDAEFRQRLAGQLDSLSG